MGKSAERVKRNKKLLRRGNGFKTATEDDLQATCVKWFRLNYPAMKKLLWHTPNGGNRSAKEGAKFKRIGVIAGVPDLFLAIPKGGYHGLFIELKWGNNTLTESQKKQCQALIDQGYMVVTECRKLNDFIQYINRYLSL